MVYVLSNEPPPVREPTRTWLVYSRVMQPGHIEERDGVVSGPALFFFSSRRRHTRFDCDWSSDVCSSDLDLTAIVLVEQRQCEPRNGMLAKVGRHISDSKAAVGLAAVVVRTAGRREGLHVPLAPCAMLAQQIGRRIIGMVMQRQEQIAVQLR